MPFQFYYRCVHRSPNGIMLCNFYCVYLFIHFEVSHNLLPFGPKAASQLTFLLAHVASVNDQTPNMSTSGQEARAGVLSSGRNGNGRLRPTAVGRRSRGDCATLGSQVGVSTGLWRDRRHPHPGHSSGRRAKGPRQPERVAVSSASGSLRRQVHVSNK